MIGALALLAAAHVVADAGPVRVGSKAFTEGVILGELATQLAQSAGARAEHKRQLGGTRLVFDALVHGDIDVYGEYTGTISEEILAAEPHDTPQAVEAALAQRGLRATAPLGFNNTYGLAMRDDTAQALGVRTISELAAYLAHHRGALAFGVSNEFLDRKDGWPALVAAYGLGDVDARGLDHDVAYRAIVSGAIAVTDCYTTDAEIVQHRLRVLVDDRAHFPRYEALFLYRKDLDPRVVAALRSLEGRIDERAMAAMNARVKIDKQSDSAVAAAFLTSLPSHPRARTPEAPRQTRTARVLQRTVEHSALVAVSLALSIVVALPLGVLAAKRRRVGQVVLAVSGVMQTIPSIALLVLFVPIVGIGSVPAVIALVLYGLLPIVRATHAGLTGISPALVESAHALGLSAGARLRLVELPLASPAIASGIATSAVIGVGTATIGALVGAGGYGQSILTGIRLDDTGLILEGALPAAFMAVVLQGAFALLERLVVPRGLRLRASVDVTRRAPPL